MGYNNICFWARSSAGRASGPQSNAEITAPSEKTKLAKKLQKTAKYGLVAQLGERSVRIHSETHPTRFSVPCFPVRFVGLSPENRIFEKSKICNFFS